MGEKVRSLSEFVCENDEKDVWCPLWSGRGGFFSFPGLATLRRSSGKESVNSGDRFGRRLGLECLLTLTWSSTVSLEDVVGRAWPFLSDVTFL